MKNIAQSLLTEHLGFSQIEALVYLNLLRESPQTGYKISTTLGKSRSNTYQALKSLELRHAIIRLEGTQYGEFIPVPIKEFMNAREKEFILKKAEIIEALKDLEIEPHQEYIIQINSTEQLYKKVHSMIEEAKSMILVDTDPGPLKVIHGWLDLRAGQGVNVLIETPGESQKDNCHHIRIQQVTPKDIEWEADWLCLSVDGEHFLISLLKKDTGELIHAIWSGNPYISPWVYNGMLHEFTFRVIRQMLLEGLESETIIKKLDAFTQRFFQPVSGFLRLQKKLNQTAEKNCRTSGKFQADDLINNEEREND